MWTPVDNPLWAAAFSVTGFLHGYHQHWHPLCGQSRYPHQLHLWQPDADCHPASSFLQLCPSVSASRAHLLFSLVLIQLSIPASESHLSGLAPLRQSLSQLPSLLRTPAVWVCQTAVKKHIYVYDHIHKTRGRLFSISTWYLHIQSQIGADSELVKNLYQQ